METLLLFVLYGVLGWGIDSGYRSITSGFFTMGNALKPIPFSPVYAFGAFLILGIAPLFAEYGMLAQALAFGLLLAGFEWASGHLSTFLFKKRLWSYGNEQGWLAGYTDLYHVGVWGMLAMVFIYLIHPWSAEVVRLLLLP